MADLVVKEFVPYQYEDVLSDIKNRLYDKGYTDVENEGSNAFKLSAILSGVISNLSFNANANIQEMILSSAYNENNIIKGAGFQGYERIKSISYQYQIQVQMTPDTSLPETDTTVREYVINRFDMFTSNGNTYYYMGDPIILNTSNNDIKNSNNNSIATIIVKEGTLYLYKDIDYLTHVVSRYTEKGNIVVETGFELPLGDIEENGVELYVTYAYNNILYEDQKWTKSHSMLMENTEEKRTFIVLEEVNMGTYKIYWKFGGSGTNLDEGSILKCNILTSNGSNGNSDGVFETINESYTYMPLSSVLRITGVDKESKSDIVVNAPRFNNTANRAVTRTDYVSLSNRRPEISKTAVWGSENEIPQYRKSAFFAYIPFYTSNEFVFDSNNNSYTRTIDETYYLLPSEINDILDYYKLYSIPSLKHEYRQPLYIDFNYTIEIASYNPHKSINVTNEDVYVALKDYFAKNIEIFDGIYFNSNSISTINSSTTYSSGITCVVDYNIPLSYKNLDNLFNDNIHYRFVGHLSYPYKYPFDSDNNVILNNLPQIDTIDWLGEGYDLTVDFDNEYQYNNYNTYNILYNGIVCGKYIIVRGLEEYIRIELYVTMTDTTPTLGDWVISNLTYDKFDTTHKLNLKYLNDNFSFIRNSIGRLNKIDFVLN